MELRVMTYNILHGMDYPLWRTEKRAVIDLSKTAEGIRGGGADICGLNEVRGAGLTPEYTAQADTIGGLLGFHHVFGRSIYVGGTEPYGNGLVSRYPIAASEVIPIPDPIVDGRVPDGVESRSVLRCTFDFAGDKHLTVLTTHFGLSLPERENAAALCRRLLESEKNPTILLGDFNFLPAEIGQADVFHLVIHTLQFPSFILRLISRQRSSGISEPTTLTTSELTSAP